MQFKFGILVIIRSGLRTFYYVVHIIEQVQLHYIMTANDDVSISISPIIPPFRLGFTSQVSVPVLVIMYSPPMNGPLMATTVWLLIVGGNGFTYFKGTDRDNQPQETLALLAWSIPDHMPSFPSWSPCLNPGSRRTGLVFRSCTLIRLSVRKGETIHASAASQDFS